MGKPGMAFPPAQIGRVIEIARYLLARYPAIRPQRDRMLRHSDIDAVHRSYCPGPTFPLAEVIAACGGRAG
jgi:N-acetyl-anhydromuramyl-L-alanine amidase AmpD